MTIPLTPVTSSQIAEIGYDEPSIANGGNRCIVSNAENLQHAGRTEGREATESRKTSPEDEGAWIMPSLREAPSQREGKMPRVRRARPIQTEDRNKVRGMWGSDTRSDETVRSAQENSDANGSGKKSATEGPWVMPELRKESKASSARCLRSMSGKESRSLAKYVQETEIRNDQGVRREVRLLRRDRGAVSNLRSQKQRWLKSPKDTTIRAVNGETVEEEKAIRHSDPLLQLQLLKGALRNMPSRTKEDRGASRTPGYEQEAK